MSARLTRTDTPGSTGSPSKNIKEGTVKDQLEALILQMHKSGILYAEAVPEFKKRFILTVVQENKGNQCKAARQLGMHRNTLSRTIAELNLDIRMLRPGTRRPPPNARPTAYDKRAARSPFP